MGTMQTNNKEAICITRWLLDLLHMREADRYPEESTHRALYQQSLLRTTIAIRSAESKGAGPLLQHQPRE